MPGLRPEQGSQIVAQYTTPIRGTWNSLAVHTVPTDALYDSMNVFLRKGKLRNRPGLRHITETQFDGPIIGATLATTPYDKIVLACSKSTLYELSQQSSEWVTSVNTSILPYGASDESTVDIALLETSGHYVALLAEHTRELLQWDGLTHQVSQIVASSGSIIPHPSSVCIAARRVIALTPPHTVQWSVTFDHTNYPPLAIYRLAQTGDVGICVRAITSLSFAVYKERSIYVARAQAGGDESAFTFAEPIRVEGPAGVHAVVDVNGAHMYMTRNGRVAVFTGAAYPQWIADGLWVFLQDDIDQRYAHLIYGVYDYRLNAAIFVYPKVGDSGKLRGMAIINIPYAGVDIQSVQPIHAAFKGTLTQSCTMACDTNFHHIINRSMFFQHKPFDRTAAIMDENAVDDDGEAFQCMFQTPLSSMPNATHSMVTVQSFLERAPGNGFVHLQPITSNGLENETGNVQELLNDIISLEKDPIVEYLPCNVPARFVGLRYSWPSTSKVRYAGATIHGRALLPS